MRNLCSDSPPDMRARPPRLAGFVLGDRLGGGPTCDVYSALDTTGKSGWAVKILRSEAAVDPSNVQLLRQEAKVGMALRHSHLVRILRLGPEYDRPRYLVMERVPGRSLRAELNRAGWLDPALAINVARQIADALATIHLAGFVHGDVKPDNLHIRPDRSAVLLDLGFAHRVDGETPFGTGFVLGTANYVAPELCEQPDRDGTPADIFSLGVTLFELLTGDLPYPSGDVETTMLRHRDAPAESLRRWSGKWPDDLEDLVDQMLSRDPAERPTARAVKQELTRLTSTHCRRTAA